MRKNIIIIFGFLFLFFSCKKDKLTGEKEILVGKWKWVYSDAIVSMCNPPSQNILITPSTENIEYSIEFMKKGKVLFYKNGNLIEEKRIVLSSWEPSNYFDSYIYTRFDIDLNNKKENDITGEISQDTLMLYPFYFPFDDSDGCSYHWSYFVRE